MTGEQDSTRTTRSGLNIYDSMLMGIGLMALFEGYRMAPEEPAGVLLVGGAGFLLFGGIRFGTRLWRKINAE